MNSKNYSKLFIAIGISFSVAWISWGALIFFGDHSYEWARGEAGDFIGGGVGAFSIIFIAYALYLQVIQNQDVFEAGVFRIYETLKPELEGLSVRIIAKTMGNNDEFDSMYSKYREGDKTVFLREMQKANLSFRDLDKANLELYEAMNRFRKIMFLLEGALKRTRAISDEDFSEALNATEIFITYRTCFNSRDKSIS
ncbi:hypothetical protein N9M50_03045 [Alphaproteobacteria bacterium]|nr:hypothetical protein [Alphaproteobacteria bacterium]